MLELSLQAQVSAVHDVTQPLVSMEVGRVALDICAHRSLALLGASAAGRLSHTVGSPISHAP